MASNKELFKKNAHLKDELEKKGLMLSSIFRINQLLNRTTNREKVLQAILDESHRIFGLTRSLILLINKAENKLEAKYCIGFSPVEEKVAFTQPLCMKTQICLETIVAKTGKIIYISDIKNDSSTLTEFDRRKEKFWNRVSYIAAPLKINREIIGVIEGDRITQKLALSKSDIKLFQSFANQASIILENARLFEQVVAERRFTENILENVPAGILTVDKDKRINSINRMAEEILKKKRQRVLGKPFSQILDNDFVNMLNDNIDNHNTPKHIEVVKKENNGRKKVYGVTSSLLESLSGIEAGAIMVSHDVTDIKQTEAMLWRCEQLQSLGRMSASIAHEVRNPLASINFNVQLLSKKIIYNKEMQRISNNILEGIDRIKTTIKRTLDFSKDIKPLMSYGYIYDVIADSISLIAPQLKTQSIEIKTDLCANIPKLLFDHHQLRTVFVNLLINAAEAMPKGGTILIQGKIEGEKVFSGAKCFQITIKDDGIGIPKETVKMVFDPFFTTKQEGTGLGLSIVCKILEHHNALIEIRSKQGRGTSVHIKFPLSEGNSSNDPL
jgi:PAS domain S-box-containing protein